MRLAVEGLSRGGRAILGPLALEVGARETVAILGPSGIGKSTLLRLVAGLEAAPGAAVEGAGRVAVVFQEPTLLPWRTVLENVAIPTGAGEAEARRRVAEVGLAGREGAFPRALSLGERRRVALARGFAAGPDTLLLDEPFVSLDPAASRAMQRLLAELIEGRAVRVILVTHVLAEALRLADRILRLDGPPARIAGELRLDRPRAERDDAWIAAREAEAAGPG